MIPYIGLVIPSRGFIMADCVSTAIRQLMENGVMWDHRMPSGLPIADCFNIPIGSLLLDHEAITHIWIVEEDIVSPYNALERLIALDADVATIDYPLRNGHSPIVTSGKKIEWCGTGCTLIKRRVFEELPFPYFRTDGCFWKQGTQTLVWHPEVLPSYGGHDIRFGIDVNRKGFIIKKVEGMVCNHLELVKRGEAGSNAGSHEIVVHSKITSRTNYTDLKIIGLDN